MTDTAMNKKRRHEGGCGCVFCKKMRTRVMSLESWEKHHLAHVGHGSGFTTAPLEHAPEGYLSHWLICPCGARILTTRDE